MLGIKMQATFMFIFHHFPYSIQTESGTVISIQICQNSVQLILFHDY
jgi:hypothetical protein